jgi:hypothetical protein
MTKRYTQEELDVIAHLISEALGTDTGVSLVENDDGTFTIRIGEWTCTGSLKQVVSAVHEYITQLRADADVYKTRRDRPR